ncbi:MAG: NERD domain-containing protein [Cyanobacteria bacterium P01_G01_bin.67]
MRFFPASTIGVYESEQRLWQALKIALEHEPGKAYFGFRPRADNGRVIKESDVLIMHQEYGICVIECKGCQIYEISQIENDEWFMVDRWYTKSMQPLAQANAAMYAVKQEIERHAVAQGLDQSVTLNIHYSHFVALPYITRQQWQEQGLGGSPTLRGAILFQEDLTSEIICHRLAAHKGWRENSLSYEEWSSIWDFCKRDNLRTTVATKTRESSGIVRLMNQIANQTVVLDQLQQKIASEIPSGPQRLRGLAGTGKTILLTKRAAAMHYEYPDWDIVFTFYTKSLYQQTKELIIRAYRDLLEGHGLTPRSPNWNQLKIFKAWGGKGIDGFYAALAEKCGSKPKTYNDVQREIQQDHEKSKKYFQEKFAYACECLEADAANIPQIYDAIIIDEGQDLPPAFIA